MSLIALLAHSDTKQAFKDALPVSLAFLTVSTVFGWMCVEQGLPVWLPALLSIFVYAGASQFSFLALVTAGASILTVVLTTFLINMRHMLMAVYMSNALTREQMSRKARWFYAFGLTDESFAYHTQALKRQHKTGLVSDHYLISFNVCCHLFWILGTLIGSVSAVIFSDMITLNLEYALTALMLYILVALTDSWDKLLVAIAAVGVMVVLNLWGESYFNLFIATFFGCGVGVWLKTLRT